MTQTHKLLSIAALFAAGALTISCNSLKEQLDTPEEVPATGKTVTLTATVGLDATTKALDATGAKTFAVGDQIAVIYEQEGGAIAKAVTNALTIDDIREEGQKADITVTLNTPAENGTVRYIYPASMALATIDPEADIDDAHTIDFTNLSAQDGTLATLAESYDLAVFDGNFNGTELPASALLSNQLAIGEFTIKNWGGTAITTDLTAFSVTDGTNTYAITPASPATKLTGPIYVAMLPVADTQELTFTATDGTYTYTRSITGKALSKNNMYPVNLKMNRIITITSETGALTLEDGEILTGTGGAETYVTIADGATITLSDVTINSITNDSSHKWAGITCNGDATIRLQGTNTVSCGYGFCPGIRVMKNKTLTIEGTGTLYASGVEGAGIGGGFMSRNSGNIIINNGTIFAQSYSGAGIGSGSESTCGNIIINGGDITATSTSGGAGIGTGRTSFCGNITITGGTVKANAYDSGGTSAAIGTGSPNGGRTECGDILISGGTVVAMTSRDSGAAGIGTGFVYEGETTQCGTITIENGITSVSVAKGSVAPYAIGRGYEEDENLAVVGIVTIDGHVMTDAELSTLSTSNENLPNLQWASTTAKDYRNKDVTMWVLTHK